MVGWNEGDKLGNYFVDFVKKRSILVILVI